MNRLSLPLTVLAALAVTLFPPLHAEEGGSGHYLPGSMASFTDGVPLEETFIVRYNFAYYGGDLDKNVILPFAGLLTAGAEAESYANGLTFLWRPPIEIGDKWSYAMSATIPYVSMTVTADVGPIRRTDTDEGLGDIVLMPLMFNYNVNKDFNINTRLGIYAPSGNYEVGSLANTSKNFWTFEPTVGLMYFGQENGIELSVFTGLSMNLENPDTQYQSGSQVHVDGTLAQHFPLGNGLAGVGLSAFYYEQVTGDKGAGATFGEFRGLTTGLGPAISYAGKLGDKDLIAELKWLHEVETERRLQGDIIWLKVLMKF